MFNFSHLLFCEPRPEERSAGNLHATFCGNRWQATATDDPVGGTYPLRGFPPLLSKTACCVGRGGGWKRAFG
jgi:hypothetical protein